MMLAALLALPAIAAASNLGQYALQAILDQGSPILGANYTKCTTGLCVWQSTIPDDTLIVHLNIPGVHDAATWNYSQTTQDSLDHITSEGITGDVAAEPYPAEYYRCQSHSWYEMLDGGIRAFDLRYALDPTNSTLVFYHSQALQSETATVQDALFGFYNWLDDHPTEALFLSFMYEDSTTEWAQDNAQVQGMIYVLLTNEVAQQYMLQTKDKFGTLGEARGKITLLRRFDLTLLPLSAESSIPGVHFSPSNWTDNDPNITLIYAPSTNGTAYIEDYYEMGVPDGEGAVPNIQWKFNATVAHLEMAASEQWKDDFFWSFASSEHDYDIPAETPIIQALGNGTDVPGVNQKLLPWLQERQGQRFGLIMIDFFGDVPGLVEAILGW